MRIHPSLKRYYKSCRGSHLTLFISYVEQEVSLWGNFAALLLKKYNRNRKSVIENHFSNHTIET